MFILDEADRLLEDGNLAGVVDLYARMPSRGTGTQRLQVCFFSATLHSKEIQGLAGKICVHPIWVDLKGVDSVPDVSVCVCVRVCVSVPPLTPSLTPSLPCVYIFEWMYRYICVCACVSVCVYLEFEIYSINIIVS